MSEYVGLLLGMGRQGPAIVSMVLNSMGLGGEVYVGRRPGSHAEQSGSWVSVR